MGSAELESLHLYPIKSCAGTGLDRARVTALGLEHDRRWLVVNPSGRFQTQRQIAKLALVAPRAVDSSVVLTGPAMADLMVDGEAPGQSVDIIVMSDHTRAIDAGDAAAAWLSEFLAESVRLVRFDPAGGRTTNPKWGGVELPIAFPDGFPILVIAKASLDDLNRRLAAPVPMNRFRPNLVVDGLEPYAEDRIRCLETGDLRLRMVYPCPRCKITTIDQARGEVAGPDPLATLREYRRRDEPAGAMFGHYAIVEAGAGATVARGDRFDVRWK